MSVSRLLILLLLAPVGAGRVRAQSLQGLQDKDVAPSSAPASQLLSRGASAPDSRMSLPAFDASALLAKVRVTRRNEGTCYSMRGYVFTRSDSKSDATRLTGYSTCQPAGQIQLRSTVQPR